MFTEKKIDDQFAIEDCAARDLQERPKGYLFILLDHADAGLYQEIPALFRGHLVSAFRQERLS